MSDIVVEIRNENFKEVTVLKASTLEKIVTLSPTQSMVFRLLGTSDSVTICATKEGSATVKLEGVKDSVPMHVREGTVDGLEDDTPLSIKLAPLTTRLTLRWDGTDPNAVKCGEVIIEPPAS